MNRLIINHKFKERKRCVCARGLPELAKLPVLIFPGEKDTTYIFCIYFGYLRNEFFYSLRSFIMLSYDRFWYEPFEITSRATIVPEFPFIFPLIYEIKKNFTTQNNILLLPLRRKTKICTTRRQAFFSDLYYRCKATRLASSALYLDHFRRRRIRAEIGGGHQVVRRSCSQSQQHPPVFLPGDRLGLHRDKDRAVLTVPSHEVYMLLRTEEKKKRTVRRGASRSYGNYGRD